MKKQIIQVEGFPVFDKRTLKRTGIEEVLHVRIVEGDENSGRGLVTEPKTARCQLVHIWQEVYYKKRTKGGRPRFIKAEEANPDLNLFKELDLMASMTFNPSGSRKEKPRNQTKKRIGILAFADTPTAAAAKVEKMQQAFGHSCADR